MKAELTEDGLLIVEAETGSEAYALQAWSSNFSEKNGKAALQIVGKVVENPE